MNSVEAEPIWHRLFLTIPIFDWPRTSNTMELSMESFILFTVFYIIFSVCFLFPPPEFVSLGLTVESIFSSFLDDENNSFIHYHIKRTVTTLMVHCSIPFVYFLVVTYMFPEYVIRMDNIIWNVFIALSVVPPGICAFVLYSWHRWDWRKHPIAQELVKFVGHGSDINQITRDIDNEYRSFDKVIIKCNAVTKVIATDNWLIKVSPYDLSIAHQSDVSLAVTSSSQYKYGSGQLEEAQYLNIDVKSSRPNVNSFQIRINSVDFKDLQEKVSRPINIMENIVVHKSLTDRFKDEFKKIVQDNPKITMNENLDICIGCLVAVANVKLAPSCGDVSGPQKCTVCYCRPLWCIDCIATWFASRQDQDRPDTWLSSKCSCPMCRSTFCVLDVCPIVHPDSETANNDNN